MYEQEADPYSVLGIDATADVETLKRAYRALSMTWHPDRHTDEPPEQRAEAERRFMRIHAAYLAVGERLRAAEHAPPAPAADVGPFLEAIRSAVASAALRVLTGQSRHAYRRVVDVSERLLTRAIEQGESLLAQGLDPALQAVMAEVGMDQPLRLSVIRVLLLATNELPWRGKGPPPDLWQPRLAPLRRALQRARMY